MLQSTVKCLKMLEYAGNVRICKQHLDISGTAEELEIAAKCQKRFQNLVKWLRINDDVQTVHFQKECNVKLSINAVGEEN